LRLKVEGFGFMAYHARDFRMASKHLSLCAVEGVGEKETVLDGVDCQENQAKQDSLPLVEQEVADDPAEWCRGLNDVYQTAMLCGIWGSVFGIRSHLAKHIAS
jgi:hypothetical protein